MRGQEPVTAVTVRLCQDPHGAQSAGGLFGYREVIFISVTASLFASTQVAFLTHPPSVTTTTGGSSGWGRQLRKIPVLSIRAVYVLYAGRARGES